jgi:hypothetical protein
MKKSYLTVALTLSCLLGLGISARAQNLDKIAANVPFDFVAGGETLPAGTYTVSRVSSGDPRSLAIRSDDNSVFLLPAFFGLCTRICKSAHSTRLSERRRIRSW